jgi:hypothetical protein
MADIYYCTRTCQHNGRFFRATERYPSAKVGDAPCEFLIPISPPQPDDKRVARAIAYLEGEILDMEKEEVINGRRVQPHPATVRQIVRMRSAIEELRGTKPATVGKAVKGGRD